MIYANDIQTRDTTTQARQRESGIFLVDILSRQLEVYNYVSHIAIPTTFTFQLTLSINFYELNTYAGSDYTFLYCTYYILPAWNVTVFTKYISHLLHTSSLAMNNSNNNGDDDGT